MPKQRFIPALVVMAALLLIGIAILVATRQHETASKAALPSQLKADADWPVTQEMLDSVTSASYNRATDMLTSAELDAFKSLIVQIQKKEKGIESNIASDPNSPAPIHMIFFLHHSNPPDYVFALLDYFGNGSFIEINAHGKRTYYELKSDSKEAKELRALTGQLLGRY
jgi:hypothetical protein